VLYYRTALCVLYVVYISVDRLLIHFQMLFLFYRIIFTVCVETVHVVSFVLRTFSCYYFVI